MSDPDRVRSFLESEVEALEPFGFVLVGAPGHPLDVVEITRGENAGLEVRVPGRPRVVPELAARVRSALRERGFASADPSDRTRPWARQADSPADAVALVARVLSEVFEHPFGPGLDVAHGSHRGEREAEQRLASVRERIEKIVLGLAGGALERDPDGDYVLPVGDVHVTVAPRVIPDGPVVVRVFAITNVGVTVAPELGLFLARLNFGLMFGRFALDAENQSIWFDENLLGDQWSDDDLRFTVRVVASTADGWDDRMKQMFGGSTWQEVLTHRDQHAAPPTKPGEGGYL